ncbi:carbohydrate kinase [Pseudonocardia kujensis]|uniref:carbohydrate kinase family protein n=1 Tax=Pseudonocardia kujensis TaxID=1128675 RepID=UPI001E2C66DC|nr:carbohydrate kinase [Pseudonocardia kujensis]MCE0763408.1 carbohydrate kinase [Pseudonocardia kujensis]
MADNGVIAVAGEALVDVVPAPAEGYFEFAPGGSPANVAVGLARLGVGARMLARLGSDFLGRRLRAHLGGNGVDLSHVVDAPEQSSLALVEVGPDGVADYDFRITGTSDWQWTPDELAGALDGIVALHSGSLALTVEPGAPVLRELMAKAAGSATVSYDPNCRPRLMGDPAEVLRGVHEMLAVADVVKVSDEDLRWLLPDVPPGEVLDDWAGRGPALVAVTLGGDGVLAATAKGIRTSMPGRAVEVVDTVGAGDSFSAALLAALHARDLLGPARRGALRGLSALTLDEVLEECVTAASITCSRRGAQPPTTEELRAALQGR